MVLGVKFTSVVVVEVRLESVLLLVNNKTDNVVVQSRRRTLLEALVTPSEALDDAQFFWFIGTHTPDPHHIHSFSYYFSRSGELTVSVLVKNRVSSVRSSEVKVLVVERIEGVRGLANHDSVHSGEHRNYTVLVDHGSHINYTWTFGDISLPVVTHKSTVSHRYRFSGVHTITVRLTSPLGQHIVVRSRVFVLQDSVDCDTPKVLRFYPLDIAVQREVGECAFL
ncbi:Polycystin-1-like 2 [Homarus americanus]|uniref:Polycystin-1-like 2 n=1 Tax=Homarus americanus TaxID=6706 RepID=A0A8J5JV52_HOMAM|nr:Polycystin-1-like 2 [Homarus americanus]